MELGRNIRVDVVVANMNRSYLFLESFNKLKGFDFDKDRLIVLDCSEDSLTEYKKFMTFLFKSSVPIDRNRQQSLGRLVPGENFLFYKRRNWNMNHGAQLDYFRLLREKAIETPQLVFFMQDHYLNTSQIVKTDTIPENFVLDLNLVFEKYLKNKKTVFFASRNGFRVAASDNRLLLRSKNPNNQEHLKKSKKYSFVIDGANFISSPNPFLHFFSYFPKFLTSGDGSFTQAVTWETRISKILYDQGYIFHELSRNLAFDSIESLLSNYPDPCSTWHYVYDYPHVFTFYGRDIESYGHLWIIRPRATARFIWNKIGSKGSIEILELSSLK